jgi:hypothetical protein
MSAWLCCQKATAVLERDRAKTKTTRFESRRRLHANLQHYLECEHVCTSICYGEEGALGGEPLYEAARGICALHISPVFDFSAFCAVELLNLKQYARYLKLRITFTGKQSSFNQELRVSQSNQSPLSIQGI